MRRILVLVMLVIFPLSAIAAPASERRRDRTALSKKKTAKAKKKRASTKSKRTPKAAPPEDTEEMPEEDPASAPSDSSSTAPASDTPKAPAPPPTPAAQEPAANLFEQPAKRSNNHRYAFVAGGVLASTAFAFGYWAQGETKRAETIPSASEAQKVLDGAQRTSATANLLYGVAAAAMVYGLVIEFLPEKTAEKASMTFHF